MPIVNADIAAVFSEIADLLEIEDANPFRVRAYRNAARMLGELGRSVKEMVEKKENLDDLPGIGRISDLFNNALWNTSATKEPATRPPIGSTLGALPDGERNPPVTSISFQPKTSGFTRFTKTSPPHFASRRYGFTEYL